MRLICGLHNLKSEFINGCVATIGNYDGVHLGHQEILKLVKKKSAELMLPAVVVIFEPQPEEFFTADKSSRLTSLREKLCLFERLEVDKVLLLKFNSRLANLTANQFIIDILINALRVKYLVVGDDFVFGHKREGNYTLLKDDGLAYGFKVAKIPSYTIDGVRVSSSLIRAALFHRDLKLAVNLLGRPYMVSGRVVHGKHLGHSVGFPTANIYLKKRELPMTGVYVVKVYGLAPKPLFGITNIGVRPTFSGKHKSFEVYIFEFNADIYGKRITIEFYKRLRDELKFGSLAELRAQVQQDIAIAREIL